MFVIKFAKTIRNNWKKSTFAGVVLVYGIRKAKSNYEIKSLMRAYCEEAKHYGDGLQNVLQPNKRLLVILNPAADKKNAEESFQDYCEPILNLGGYIVDIVKTDSEGYAKRYVENLQSLPDALLIAGGDGTVSEVITGLLRRNDGAKCPLGILPVGRSNDTAKSYFNLTPSPDSVKQADELARTAMLVLKGNKEKKNILKIQPISEEGETNRPVYALNKFHWGAFRDAKSLQDKYWYYGPLRAMAAVFFNCLNKKITWDCAADLQVTPPCSGCKYCYLEENSQSSKIVGSTRWWGRYVPKTSRMTQTQQSIDYSKIINEDCIKTSSNSVKSSEIIIVADNDSPAKLHLETTASVEPGIDFIKENWNRLFTKNQVNPTSVVEGRTISLVPQMKEKYIDKFFYIDNEEYEVRPIKISLIPSAFDVYTF